MCRSGDGICGGVVISAGCTAGYAANGRVYPVTVKETASGISRTALDRKIHGLLSATLKHRKTALALALVFLVGSVASVTRLPVGFMPEGDISVTQIEVELPPGTPVEQTQQRLRTLTKSLKDRPEIKSVYTIAGVADDADGIAQHKGKSF